ASGEDPRGCADSPRGVHGLYGGRHRQRRRLGAAGTSRLGGPLGAAPARLAPAHRSVFVRAAVCHQVAQRAMHRRMGVKVMAETTSKKSAKVAKKAGAQAKPAVREAKPS